MRFLFLSVFLFSSSIFAQNPYNVKYGIEEGLPTSNIYSTFEDSAGYVWFGTDVGVLKFDGYNFEHFSTDDGLSDNEVFKFYEDSKHRIWFITLNGKLSFYQNGRFENTHSNQILEAASNSKMITDIFEFEGKIHVLYRGGRISKMDVELKFTEHSSLGSPLFGYWIKHDKLFYLTIENIIDSQNILIHSIQDKRNSSLGYRAVLHNNESVFSIKGALFAFDSLGVTEILNFENDDIIHLSSIDNKLFIGTRTGLYIKSNTDVKKYFLNDAISYIDKDSQGNFWITTLNDGIKFVPNFNVSQYKLGTDNIKINALKKDKNHVLWIGTTDGLYKLNTKHSIVKITDHNYVNKIRFYENSIFSIGNEKTTIIDDTSIKTLNFGANDFYYDGNIYLFSSSVVFKFNNSNLHDFPQIRKKNTINSQALIKYTLFNKRTNVITNSENGNVLFGTSLGLYCFSKDSIYQVSPLSEELNSSILDIYYDTDRKDVIIATNSNGISVLKNHEIIHHISKQEKLSSNTCYSIKPFDSGYLVGTNKGLDFVSYSKTEYTVRNLNAIYGLKNEKINDIEVIDSIIYLGTDKGLIRFSFNDQKSSNTKPILDVNSVLINGKQLDDLGDLKHSQKNLSLNFTGISYSDYGKLDYEYRINEKPWISINTRNLEIKNLSFGKQNIQLRVKGRNGVWSTIKTVELFINKPFWRTIPFMFFISVLIAALVYLIVRKRIKTIQDNFNKERKLLKEQQEKTALEKQMAELEQKALRLQMNPHFIFNALNTIKGYYSGGDISKANKYISRFSKLLRLILESDQHVIPIDKEIEMLELYIKLIRLRYNDNFDYDINVLNKLKIEDYGIPPLLLQPMVENAVIHGLAPNEKVKGKLHIEFSSENNMLVCKVIDNGIGIVKSRSQKKENHNSKAIQINRERIEMVNESKSPENFKIEDLNTPSGTKITIKLPLIKLW